VDGNVIRVLSRRYQMSQAHWAPKGRQDFQSKADELANSTRPADVNQALMELGATHCAPKNPKCEFCPLSQSCLARAKNLTDHFPQSRKSLRAEERFFAVFIITRGLGAAREYALQKRGESESWWAGLWEFPTIEVDRADQKPKNWAVRSEKIGRFSHSVTRYKLNVDVYWAEENRLPPGAIWTSAEALKNYSSSSLLKKALRVFAAAQKISSNRI
jgi:A/G-specific adenine glycosylase